LRGEGREGAKLWCGGDEGVARAWGLVVAVRYKWGSRVNLFEPGGKIKVGMEEGD